MILKRITVSLCTIMICMMMFLSGYAKVVNLYSYADSVTDEWYNVTSTEEMAEAFRYYCKSRDLTIDGSIANAVTQFTTQTFNGICKTIGVDMTAIQANLKYNVDSNGVKRFLFSNGIITTYNRIFAQFLQDNNLAVGDENVNKTLKSGTWWEDDQGNGCFIFKTSNNYSGSNSGADKNTITEYGTPYMYDSDYYKANLNVSISQTVGGNNLDAQVYKNNSNNYLKSKVRYNSQTWGNEFTFNEWYTNGSKYYWNAYFSVIKFNNGYLCFCHYEEYPYNNPTYKYIGVKAVFNGQTTESTSVTVVSPIINNNTYEGDTIINNYGTPSDPNTPDPDPDPDPDTPNYNPYPDGGGGTTPPTNTGGGSGEDDSTITFPDFDFHLPEINWSLGDLSEKFPFSIPFDLIAFFTVLNAEPQAPSIDANIPLGSWYTWHFEADFAQFDNYAVIIRNVEFIGFCVGLIYLTIKLVKG